MGESGCLPDTTTAQEAALDNDECHCARCPLFLHISLRIRIELFRRFCFTFVLSSQFPPGGIRGVRWRMGRGYAGTRLAREPAWTVLDLFFVFSTLTSVFLFHRLARDGGRGRFLRGACSSGRSTALFPGLEIE